MPKTVSRLLVLLFLLALWTPTWSAVAASSNEQATLAVLPFQVNAEPELQYLRDGLPQLLADQLKGQGFTLVDKDKLDRIITDQNVAILDLATAKDLALLAGANFALYGSFSQVGDTLSLDVRLVDAFGIKPAKPLFVVKEGLINVLPAVEELAAKVKAELLRKEVIADIQVKGAQILDQDVVLMRLKSQKGDAYDPKLVGEDLKRIFELGYFEDISMETEDLPEGKRLIVTVKEKPRISAIGIKGAGEVDQDDVLSVMATKTGGVLNEKILADDLNKIRELYHKEGYYLAKVDYEIERTGDSPQARLNVVVEEGAKLYIKKIAINGAKELDEGDLKDELALSERGIFSWVTGSGVLNEEILERDASALEAYYHNRGFIEAKAGQPSVEFKEDGIYIDFNIVEGRRYKPGKVTFKGDLLETPEKLSEVTKLDDLGAGGEYFSREVLRDDAQALSDYYSDYGYAYAQADYTLDKHDEDQTVDVAFMLRKNQKVYIRRVTLEGNTKTRDNVIRREMRLGDGDLFSASKMQRSSQRLDKLDYFEVADIQNVPTDDPSQLDLVVNIKEKSTGMISGGVGYSTYGGAFLAGKVVERNLFGKGYFSGFSGTIGGKQTTYELSFTNPHYNDTNLAVGGDLYLTRDEYYDYDKNTVGGRTRFSYPLGEYTHLLWSYRLESYEITEVESNAAKVIKDIEGDNIASVAAVSAVRDTTDRRLNPTTGAVYSASLEHGGGVLGGSDSFIKTIFDTSYYLPVFKKLEHVFHWHGQLGFAFENFVGDDEIPVFERYHLGGINSVRGYPSRRISPIDEASGDRIGGTKAFFTNFEYLFPLYKEGGLMGLGFFDAGNAWTDDDWDMGDLKKSVGTGLRWYSPFGPLRLEYGYALDEILDQGSKHKIEFSMGQFF